MLTSLPSSAVRLSTRAIAAAALVFGALVAHAAPALAQTGLVAAYSFDEGTGTVARDTSGKGNNGTLSNANWAAAGKFGGAISFNGVSSWVTVADAPSLALTTAMTVEAWVQTPSPAGWRCVLLKESSSGLSYGLYGGDGNGRAAAYIRRTADIDATAGSPLPSGVWVHVASTYDGATLRVYVNGVEEASQAITGSIVTSTSPLRIGGDAPWGEYFSGLIDEVRIYNRALSPAEVQADMNTRVGGVVTPPSTFALSGAITPAASGSGTSVTVAGPANATVTADATGAFTASGLPNGTYTVTPAKAGFSFAPATRTVVINGANASGATFTATASAPPSAIRLVQKAVNGAEGATGSLSAAFPTSNTAGNFLIVTGTAARPAGTLTISDTLGNTYLPALGPVSDPAQDVNAYIWYVPNARAGANTVTIEPTSPRAIELHISEWAGLAQSTPLDKTSWTVGVGSTASSASVVPSSPGELIFAYTFIENSATQGAGFTPLSLINGDLDEYLIQTTAAPVTATFTQAAAAWNVALATFRPRPSGGDTTAPTVAITSPANGATVSSNLTLAASATDNLGVAGVQFQVDGVNLGAEITAPPYTVAWNTVSSGDGAHTIRALARDAAGNIGTSSAVAVTVANVQQPSVVGQWGASFDVGIVAVNTVLLHTGKVLMYSGTFQISAPERVWDPATGTITLVPNPFSNLFCSGQAQLPDGRILVAGGYDSGSLGAANANIFDPVTLAWTAAPNMAFRRWYPTVTGLPDGRMLVTSGGQTCLSCLADTPEIFDPKTSKFSKVTTAALPIWYYPFMFVLPDGRVLSAGSNEQPYETRALNLTTGTWSMIDPVVRDGHSAVMYRPGKILKTGTAADSGTAGNAVSTAFVLDMTQPSPAWRQVASMRFPRAFQNSTILPDGNVLITGGGTALDGYDVTKGIKTAELWSPATETFQSLAPASLARLYHSTALLLPDARVLIAGSGDDGPAVDQTRAEIYSPPYLFKGARPTITQAPSLLQYGAGFTVSTPDAASIQSIALIRLGATTHAFDQDQRYVELSFTKGAGLLTVTAPANANLAPPGYYMLFLVNSTGVPSIASFVHFAPPGADAQPPSAPAGLLADPGLGAIALRWTASTDNVGVSVYNVYRSRVAGVAPSPANLVAQVGAITYTDTALAPGTYFYVVTAQDAAGNVSVASNEASATIVGDTVLPSVSVTAPLNLSTVSGSVTLAANASDNIGVVGVQFLIDGAALGAERTAAPYTTAWNTGTAANGSHTVSAVARDAAGNRSTSTVTVTVSNAVQIPTGLVAAYGFDEGAGTTVADASGSNNAGTIKVATWSASGHTGSALSFDGASAWVAVPAAASLNLTTGMTLEAWVRPTATTSWRTVVLKEGPNSLSYALYASSDSTRPGGWIHNANTDPSVVGTATLALNAWTHVAVTYDGSALRFYTNGVLVNTTSAVPSILTTTGGLKIGGNAVWGEYFKGLIDDVRVYNKALTAAQIVTDMNTAVK